jgi:hypothetical protein
MSRLQYWFGQRGRALALSLLALWVTGCGGEAVVEGTVTFNNEPLRGGDVVFVPVEGGGGGPFKINPADGTYRATKLPVGKWKVGVVPIKSLTPNVPPGMNFGPPKDRAPLGRDKGAPGGDSLAKPTTIPGRYHDPDNSGLEVEVKSGLNPFDISLKDK